MLEFNFLDITNYVEYSNESLAEMEIEVKFQQDIPIEWNNDFANDNSEAFKKLQEEYVQEQTKKFSGLKTYLY